MKSDTNEEKSIEFGVKECKTLRLLARVSTLLYANGLTQAKLAEKMGVSRQYLNGILHERMSCPLHMRVRMARVLKVDSACIFHPKEYDEQIDDEWNPDHPYKELNGKREEDEDS